MKGVKIEMSEAQAQNWEKTKGERGEKTELYHMYYNLFSSGIKKKTTPIVMMEFSWDVRQTNVMKYYFLHT